MELWLTVNGKAVSASSQLDPLTRAVVISLFTHRRADPDDNVDVPRGGGGIPGLLLRTIDMVQNSGYCSAAN